MSLIIRKVFMDLKKRLIEQSEIYLFECSPVRDNGIGALNTLAQTPKVNEFVAFLKYYQIPSPYKFTTISGELNLISDLSLKENILLNFNSDSLTSSKNHQFDEILLSIKNPYIAPLLQYFHEGDLKPHEASKEAIKCAQLLRALLSDSHFIFMESPEKDLSYQLFSIFLKALKHHCKDKVVNVFISSPNPELWLNEAHYVIKRNDKFQFVVEKARIKDLMLPFESRSSEFESLNFKIPEPKSKKDAA